MRKNLVTKLFFTLLIICSIVIINHDVKATNVEQANHTVNKNLDTEEKIMKYDAITNETTEVDMEELRNVLAKQKTRSGDEIYTLDSYTPYIPELSNRKAFSTLASNASAQRIMNTSIAPYKYTCRAVSNNGGSLIFYGSASIVGPNIALTSAHCIFDQNNGNAVKKDWTLYAGYNGGSYYGTACGWSQVYYSNNWKETHDFQYDWAICILEANVGNQVGYNRYSIL